MNFQERERVKSTRLYKELDNKVRQQRMIEAKKKKIGEKSATVARFMGAEVRAPGFTGLNDFIGYSEERYDFDAYSYDDEDEIIEVTQDGFGVIGWCFDALSYGCNIQVTVMIEDHHVIVSCDGEVVFEEMAGDLITYRPAPIWEQRIEHWFKRAETLKRSHTSAEEREKTQQANSLLQQVRELLKLTWGI